MVADLYVGGVHDQRSLRGRVFEAEVLRRHAFVGTLVAGTLRFELEALEVYEVAPQGIDLPGIGPPN
jgi:hypothetical protein